MSEGDASYARERASRYRKLARESSGSPASESLEELAGELDRHADDLNGRGIATAVGDTKGSCPAPPAGDSTMRSDPMGPPTA